MKYSFNFVARLLAVAVALFQPFICILACGQLHSMSMYWETPLQPLFIITNAMVSYHFFGLRRWRLSALLLLFVTAFSVTLFPTTHGILAVLFFISCLYPLLTSKRFKYYGYAYLLISTISWIWGGLFIFEICGIVVLCTYHLHILIYRQYMLSKK